METLRALLWEFWNYALLTYRTTVIRAELKRRRSVSHSRHQSSNGSKADLLSDHNQSECRKDGHSIRIIEDISSSAATPSAMDNYERSELKRVFDLFDENKDGLISAEELQLYMKRLRIELPDERVRDMVQTVDRNRDDHVDFEDFISLYSPACRGVGEGSTHDSQIAKLDDDHEEDLLKTFFVFDENKDGLISVLELQQVLLRLGLPEGRSLMGCQKMISKVDADGNGKVDFFEFKEMMSCNACNLYKP